MQMHPQSPDAGSNLGFLRKAALLQENFDACCGREAAPNSAGAACCACVDVICMLISKACRQMSQLGAESLPQGQRGALRE